MDAPAGAFSEQIHEELTDILAGPFYPVARVSDRFLAPIDDGLGRVWNPIADGVKRISRPARGTDADSGSAGSDLCSGAPTGFRLRMRLGITTTVAAASAVCAFATHSSADVGHGHKHLPTYLRFARNVHDELHARGVRVVHPDAFTWLPGANRQTHCLALRDKLCRSSICFMIITSITLMPV